MSEKAAVPLSPPLVPGTKGHFDLTGTNGETIRGTHLTTTRNPQVARQMDGTANDTSYGTSCPVKGDQKIRTWDSWVRSIQAATKGEIHARKATPFKPSRIHCDQRGIPEIDRARTYGKIRIPDAKG